MVNSDLQSRFWSRVDRKGDNECWPWTGAKRDRGYGTIMVSGRNYQATRIAWQIANDAEWPVGRFACHHCDNPPCVNPAHLYPGTHADNVRDMVQRGRHRSVTGPKKLRRTVCENGHAWKRETLSSDNSGKHRCLICKEERAASRGSDRFGHGKICRQCGHLRIDDYPTGKGWQCRACNKQRETKRLGQRKRVNPARR